MKSFGKEALSPIFAVVLMIAITIILAAILYVWTGNSMCGNGGKDTPKGAISTIGSSENSYTVKVVDMNPEAGINEIMWYLYDQNGNIFKNIYGDIVEIYELVDGNVTYHDNDRDGNVSAEDTFSVTKKLSDGTKIPEGYSLTLKFVLTDDAICSAVLKG